MPEITKVSDYKKLYHLLQLISLLRKSGFDIARLASRFQVTERTIYRYFDLLKDVGFQLEKSFDKKYTIVSHHKDVEWVNDLSFTLEEVELIQEAIDALYFNHPLKTNLFEKLFAFSELDSVADLVVNSILSKNINLVYKAIKEEKQAILKQYQSTNSNGEDDRLVEPVAFIHNMKYLLAYEVASQEIKQFKPERIGLVELTDRNFQYKDFHQKQMPDHFGMNSSPCEKVEIELSARACSLLKEEFVLTSPFIETASDGHYVYSAEVKGYEGVGRFVMGLPGETRILASEGLKDYVREKLLKDF
jgi:proteasome accessory factor C